jgi:PAS domain S-box-containing protein
VRPSEDVAVSERPRSVSASTSDLAIVVVDPGGVVLGADAGFLRLTGYSREEIEGHDFTQVIGFDDLQEPSGELLRGPQRSAAGWYLAKDGTRSRATFKLAPVSDERAEFAALTIVLWPERTSAIPTRPTTTTHPASCPRHVLNEHRVRASCRAAIEGEGR